MKIADCSTRTFVQPPRDPCYLSLPYMSWRKRIQATKADHDRTEYIHPHERFA